MRVISLISVSILSLCAGMVAWQIFEYLPSIVSLMLLIVLLMLSGERE